MALIEAGDIMVGRVTAAGTVRVDLLGPLFQSVGGNPITLKAMGKTEEDLISEAIAAFTRGYLRITNNDETDYAMTPEEIIKQWEDQMHAFIAQRYPDQTKFLLLAASASADTPAAIKAGIEPAWQWCQQVWGYWKACSAKLLAGVPIDDIGWDLDQFDALDPKITLEDLIAQAKA